jgi:N-succinyldiaminopimelate aminotransferase
MGSIADSSNTGLLRLENLDCDIAPDPVAIAQTQQNTIDDASNSYLPFIGQSRLRSIVAQHEAKLSGYPYSERNVLICVGGLSGILNVLLATVEVGDEVILTDPTYAGLINRVRLAGGIPKLVPFRFHPGKEWKLDVDALREAAASPRVTTMLLMSPSMPTGACFTADDWSAVAELCVKHNLLLIHDTAMQRLLFDDREVFHPASIMGMADRTISVGSCSKELRMIGWRVGWIVAPEPLIPDLTAVNLANVVVPVGIAQDAVATALERSRLSEMMGPYVRELQTRRDVLVKELEGLPIGIPAGGWSMLLRVDSFGIDGEEASKRLLKEGICATGMKGWGDVHGEQYVRFVFSNEPVERLQGIGRKVRAALGDVD